MNKLKNLIAATVLTFVLTVAAGAQQSPTCKPGETQTPPCPSSLEAPDDSVVPGETQTPPDEPIVNPLSLVECAIYALLLA